MDFPGDLLGSILPEGAALESPLALPEPPKVYSDPADVKRAVDLLKTAQRPLLIVGKGAAYAHAENIVNEFVKQTNIPVQLIYYHYCFSCRFVIANHKK